LAAWTSSYWLPPTECVLAIHPTRVVTHSRVSDWLHYMDRTGCHQVNAFGLQGLSLPGVRWLTWTIILAVIFRFIWTKLLAAAK
jgi:hypothetical protein